MLPKALVVAFVAIVSKECWNMSRYTLSSITMKILVYWAHSLRENPPGGACVKPACYWICSLGFSSTQIFFFMSFDVKSPSPATRNIPAPHSLALPDALSCSAVSAVCSLQFKKPRHLKQTGYCASAGTKQTPPIIFFFPITAINRLMRAQHLFI